MRSLIWTGCLFLACAVTGLHGRARLELGAGLNLLVVPPEAFDTAGWSAQALSSRIGARFLVDFGASGQAAAPAAVFLPGMTPDFSLEPCRPYLVSVPSARAISLALAEDVPGFIYTVAGTGEQGFSGDGGSARFAMLAFPVDVAVDREDNLYIADMANHRIRKIDARTGSMSTVVGNGRRNGRLRDDFFAYAEGDFGGDAGPATQASLNAPTAVRVGPAGSLYIFDEINGRIRKVDGATGTITTFCGAYAYPKADYGIRPGNPFYPYRLPQLLAVDDEGRVYLNVTDVRSPILNDGIERFGEFGIARYRGLALNGELVVRNCCIASLISDATQRIRYTAAINPGAFGILALSAEGSTPTTMFRWRVQQAGTLSFAQPGSALSVHGAQMASFSVVDLLQIMTPFSGDRWSVFAGGGRDPEEAHLRITGLRYSGDGAPAIRATFASIGGMAFDSKGNLYVADTLNHVIRKIVPSVP